MNGKIVLVSNDQDFFEYIIPKLSFRSSDELYKYSFSGLYSIIDFLKNAVLIINSENNREQTLELLSILRDSPAYIFSYNEDEDFKIKTFDAGGFGYITLLTSEKELESQLKPALKLVSSYEKNKLYRDMLVDSNLISKTNEVFYDFNKILDRELDNLQKNVASAVLIAISPDDNSKFLIQPNQIETAILNSVRKNDILMNYAPNKYFLLLKNTNINQSKKLWEKIRKVLPDCIYAGMTIVGAKKREQVVNEALNNLHTVINLQSKKVSSNVLYQEKNFKNFRLKFKQKFEQIVAPVFYQVQQIYVNKLFNIQIEQKVQDDSGLLKLKSKNAIGTFLITCPGFATVNIDITFKTCGKKNDLSESKRISLEHDELESGLLMDLIEQFISEFKESKKLNGEMNYDNT